jgi:hypothetical protein
MLMQVRPSVVSGAEVWTLLQQHLTGHMLRVGGTFLQQRTGIAQVRVTGDGSLSCHWMHSSSSSRCPFVISLLSRACPIYCRG